jgi:iron complex outermembrane recepter protein
MHIKCFRSNLLASVSASSFFLCLGTAAYAEDQVPEATSNSGVSEIIVTAERREQSLQKAPLTIQVLGGDEVASPGLSNVTDLNKLTTGMEIGLGGANAQIYIRGVGDFSFSPISNPGVAFNVDGVYVGRPDGVSGNFYDVARIEVLKGPQGTLYGRNANGGSINVITNAPKLGQRSLDFSIEAGNYSLLHAQAAVNLPVGSNAALRAAFNAVTRDGYLSDGTNDDVERSGRLRLLWEPSSRVSVIFNSDYSHIGGKGGGYTYLPRRPGADPWEALSEPAANAYENTYPLFGPLTDDARPDSRQNSELYNFSAQLDWDLGFATLTAIPAYRHVRTNSLTYIASRFDQQTTDAQTSFEARLGNSNASLTWVLGGYYYHQRGDGLVNIFTSDILQNVTLAYQPWTNAYAAFGQGTYSLSPSIRLIAGGRYTYERRKMDGLFIDQSPLTGGPGRLVEAFGGRKSFDGWTYKLGAEADLGPQSMAFATYSTGFKAGGFNQTTGSMGTYRPEKLASFEVGFRNRFLGNRLQLNFGGFHWRYKDLQDQRLAVDPAGVLNFLTFNSGTATIYGGNLDLVFKASRNDTLTLSAEYAHSKYDRYFFKTPSAFFNPASSGCQITGPYAPGAALPYKDASGIGINDGPLPVIVGNCSGFQVARVPKWTGLVTYSHRFDMSGGGSIDLGVSSKFNSSRWLGVDFIPVERAGGYVVFDADLTYTTASSAFSVAAFARNIGNRAYHTGGYQQPFVAGLYGATIAPPATYGLRVRVRM